MNHDKIQKWHGYQEYYLVTDTFPAIVLESAFSLPVLGRFLLHEQHRIDPRPDVVIKLIFSYFIWEYI